MKPQLIQYNGDYYYFDNKTYYPYLEDYIVVGNELNNILRELDTLIDLINKEK